jgi:hypothetical protein
LTLGTCLKIDEPEILVLDFSLQEHKRAPSGQKGQVSRAARERQSGQRMHYGIGSHGFHRKGGADVGPRVDNEVAVGRPRRID